MIFGCCGKKAASPSNNFSVAQNGVKTSNNGLENPNYRGVDWQPNANENVVQTEEPRLNGLKNKSQDEDNISNEKFENGSTLENERNQEIKENEQNVFFPDKEVIKKNNKNGVTWAASVDVCSETNVSDVSQIESSLEVTDTVSQASSAVPTIVVENVDTDQQSTKNINSGETKEYSTAMDSNSGFSSLEEINKDARTYNEQSRSNQTANEECNKDLLFQPIIIIQETDSIDSAFIEDVSNNEEEQPTPTSLSRQSSSELHDDEYKHVSAHLKSMAEHIQKLGSLIDRFNGVFMSHLHDEIEADLRCCSNKVAATKCQKYDNLLKIQDTIQEKIKNYIVVLDAKSEKSPTTDSENDVSQYVDKLKEIQEKLETVCMGIDKQRGQEGKDSESDQILILKKISEESQATGPAESEDLKQLKDTIQEKVDSYIDILKQRQVPVTIL